MRVLAHCANPRLYEYSKEDLDKVFDAINQELGTTVLIVTHDVDIAYKVGRVVMIRDGKMSTEIRRKVTFERRSGSLTDQPLEEFVLVDTSGRVQIPREYLEELKIKEKVRLTVRDGHVALTPEEHED